ncbi:ornithine cyclodeaminase family protein [Actinomadura sp. HBU206391]|uniref:ornithine cyclodeaminase family protein n=1 Tax=Actinomadura sp. HBU206391 TaxID=2731692 RepID=UPI001650D38F|nr:ornithine cyclodeaminase family protein [Actinomadura sp. HBU206391]MBC6460481.1 ornithine cyclodeaminase family protein [Actinomadura sp. HBU206391]
MTVLLTRSDVRRLLEIDAALGALRAGFTAERPPVDALRVRTDLPLVGSSATALLPGLIDGIPAYTVKVNAKFPGAVPALRGLLCLHSIEDGALLAVMDSAEVTAWRTGLSAALATDVLAPRGADTLGVIGAGAQAWMVVRGLAALRRHDSVVVCDLAADRARDFAAQAEALTRAPAQVVATPRQVAAAAATVVVATWAREPLLDAPDVPPGGHVTSLGADEPGKRELSAELLRRATLVVDDVPLSLRMGAVGNAGLDEEAVAATLAQVLRGEHPGRSGAGELTVYAPVGLPWQDLALAWICYEAALTDDGGTRLDFLS